MTKIFMAKRFKEVSAAFLEFHKPKIKINSHQMYISRVKQLNEEFGEYYIDDITIMMVQTYLNNLVTERHLKESTVKKHRITLNLIFKFAIINNYISSNPVTLTTMPKCAKNKPRRSLNKEEIMHLCSIKEEGLSLYLYLLLYTGVRRSEALALTWEDINFNENLIHIYKTITFYKNKPHLNFELKNGDSERYIPLFKPLREKLLNAKGKKSGYIFQFGKGLANETQIEMLWRGFKASNEIGYTQHNLRHTFATMLYNAGVDVKAAQNILGHRHLQTTLDIYTHLDKAHFVKEVSKVEDFLKDSDIYS